MDVKTVFRVRLEAADFTADQDLVACLDKTDAAAGAMAGGGLQLRGGARTAGGAGAGAEQGGRAQKKQGCFHGVSRMGLWRKGWHDLA